MLFSEHAAPRKSFMSAIPLIDNPDNVTADWLTAVLSGAGYDGTVTSFTKKNVGTGQVGQNVRFALSFDGDHSAPDTIVGKFPSSDAESRAAGVSQLTYMREAMFYKHILPTVQIQTPTPLFVDFNEETHAFVLMMEDLAPAVQGDQITGCSIAHASLAMDQIAKLHGPRWGDTSLDDISWLAGTKKASSPLDQDLYLFFWNGFKERYAERLTQDEIDLGTEFSNYFLRYASEYDGPRCVTHGDYRLDNMLFGTSEGGHPLAVVDWQTVGYGPGASDVSYFIGAGLLAEDRRAHEKDLVKQYHQGLLAFGVKGYSFDDLWHHYRRFSFSGFVMAVIASMLVGRTDRGDDMFMAMAKRHAQQAVDHDAMALVKAS